MDNSFIKASLQSDDLFVGLRFKGGNPEVVFPHGYHIPTDMKELRRDVFRLLSTIKRFNNLDEGEIVTGSKNLETNFPLESYQYIINDYLVNGYYYEKEIKYVKALSGKTDWKRTIQKEKPYLNNDNIVYLSFQVKKSEIKDDNLISLIHQYCVYQSFYRFGWLYLTSEYIPPKPVIEFNRTLFLSVLNEKLYNTFNDEKRKLFQSMINIVNCANENIDLSKLAIGVYKFQTVWERLIDHVFGESDKERYFPKASWTIINPQNTFDSSNLEPDTIMKHGNNVYILDAKYYKYGITGNPNDLPPTSSVQKQITYSKHVDGMREVDPNNIYNAFVLPFDANGGDIIKFVSVAKSSWEQYGSNTPNYAYVLGLLLDTKHIISTYSRYNETEIERMADKIEESMQYYRNNFNNNNE